MWDNQFYCATVVWLKPLDVQTRLHLLLRVVSWYTIRVRSTFVSSTCFVDERRRWDTISKNCAEFWSLYSGVTSVDPPPEPWQSVSVPVFLDTDIKKPRLIHLRLGIMIHYERKCCTFVELSKIEAGHNDKYLHIRCQHTSFVVCLLCASFVLFWAMLGKLRLRLNPNSAIPDFERAWQRFSSSASIDECFQTNKRVSSASSSPSWLGFYVFQLHWIARCATVRNLPFSLPSCTQSAFFPFCDKLGIVILQIAKTVWKKKPTGTGFFVRQTGTRFPFRVKSSRFQGYFRAKSCFDWGSFCLVQQFHSLIYICSRLSLERLVSISWGCFVCWLVHFVDSLRAFSNIKSFTDEKLSEGIFVFTFLAAARFRSRSFCDRCGVEQRALLTISGFPPFIGSRFLSHIFRRWSTFLFIWVQLTTDTFVQHSQNCRVNPAKSGMCPDLVGYLCVRPSKFAELKLRSRFKQLLSDWRFVCKEERILCQLFFTFLVNCLSKKERVTRCRSYKLVQTFLCYGCFLVVK